jgi:exoribonuclease II
VEKGTLVEFRVHGDRRLAVADRPDGKKNWVVVDENGQPHSIPPKQISYEAVGETYKPSDISKFLKEVEAYSDPSSLEVAWELLVGDGENTDPEALAMLLFSDRTPAQCYAAYCLLSTDKLYFKQKGDRYEPRPVAQVAEIKHQQEVEQQRHQESQGFWDRVKRRLAGENNVDWATSDRTRLDALERFATLGEEATHRTPALETLASLQRPENPEAAFQLLVDLGLWSPHENLFLRRSQIPLQLSAKVLEVAQSCLEEPSTDSDTDRLDLTHLKVYTIDDESTTEIDDGLSLEFLENGQQRLWIHIADPTRLLSPGDELDLEARKRTTTVYLPTGMIPMFPPALATGPMSLIQGKECSALSFSVTLDEIGAAQDYSIHISKIKPTYRLTYDDVDEMLELGIKRDRLGGKTASKMARSPRRHQHFHARIRHQSPRRRNQNPRHRRLHSQIASSRNDDFSWRSRRPLRSNSQPANTLPLSAAAGTPPRGRTAGRTRRPSPRLRRAPLYAPQRNGSDPRTPRRFRFGILHSSYFPHPPLYRLADSLPN